MQLLCVHQTSNCMGYQRILMVHVWHHKTWFFLCAICVLCKFSQLLLRIHANIVCDSHHSTSFTHDKGFLWILRENTNFLLKLHFIIHFSVRWFSFPILIDTRAVRSLLFSFTTSANEAPALPLPWRHFLQRHSQTII